MILFFKYYVLSFKIYVKLILIANYAYYDIFRGTSDNVTAGDVVLSETEPGIMLINNIYFLNIINVPGIFCFWEKCYF